MRRSTDSTAIGWRIIQTTKNLTLLHDIILLITQGTGSIVQTPMRLGSVKVEAAMLDSQTARDATTTTTKTRPRATKPSPSAYFLI